MALKVTDSVELTPALKPGQTNYSDHLVSKPIVSTASLEKKVAGNEWEGAVGISTVEHPGVFNKKNSACLITVEGARTINLGKFESARFGVSITIPTDPENIMAAYNYGCDFLEKKIESALSQLKPNE